MSPLSLTLLLFAETRMLSSTVLLSALNTFRHILSREYPVHPSEPAVSIALPLQVFLALDPGFIYSYPAASCSVSKGKPKEKSRMMTRGCCRWKAKASSVSRGLWNRAAGPDTLQPKTQKEGFKARFWAEGKGLPPADLLLCKTQSPRSSACTRRPFATQRVLRLWSEEREPSFAKPYSTGMPPMFSPLICAVLAGRIQRLAWTHVRRRTV